VRPKPIASANERRNYQKYANPNPLQRWLLNRFQRRVAHLVAFSVDQMGALPCILDVGCGEGYVLEYLRGRVPHIFLCGVDWDRGALELARAANGDIPYHCGDALNLPFADGSFDLVMCLEVLEHLESPWLALDELRRVSRRDLLVSVPNQPLFSLANLLRGKNWPAWGEDPEHVQHWRGKSFVSLIGERLPIRRVVYSFPWVIVLASAENK